MSFIHREVGFLVNIKVILNVISKSICSGLVVPAKTGSDNNNNTAVINTAHPNNGNLSIGITLMFIIVVIKFIAPINDDIPAKCNENIAKSTPPDPWYPIDDNGGYQICWLPQIPHPLVALNRSHNCSDYSLVSIPDLSLNLLSIL